VAGPPTPTPTATRATTPSASAERVTLNTSAQEPTGTTAISTPPPTLGRQQLAHQRTGTTGIPTPPLMVYKPRLAHPPTPHLTAYKRLPILKPLSPTVVLPTLASTAPT
jgi:hypothetical protein